MDTDLPFVVSSVQELDDPSRYINEKLYHISGKLDEENEERRTNIKYVVRDGVRFYDLRGNESSPNLDRDGFCYNLLPHTLEYAGGEQALQKYIDDSLAYIKAELGAEKVICYDYFFRRTRNEFIQTRKVQGSGTLLDPGTGVNQPHVDLTENSGLVRIRRHLLAEELGLYLDDHWRIRIINAWVPVNNPVESSPLAFCDFKTIQTNDLYPCDRVTEDFVGETYHLQYDPAQRWYWLSNQTPYEMSLFVSFDSKSGGPFVPHVAFPLASSDDARSRESIEMRLIVITPKDL